MFEIYIFLACMTYRKTMKVKMQIIEYEKEKSHKKKEENIKIVTGSNRRTYKTNHRKNNNIIIHFI